MWGAIIGGIASLAGSIFGASKSSSSAKDAATAAYQAAVYQADTIKELYNQNRSDLLPFLHASGQLSQAIADLPGETAGQARYQQMLDNLSFPTVDTGGAESWLDRLSKTQSYLPTADTAGAETWIKNLSELTFPEGVDPTGGMQKYISQLEGLEFEFDSSDPIYLWRKQEQERLINQGLASRGEYDSRKAIDILAQENMRLQSDELTRQYNQRYLSKYNQLTTLAGMAYQKGQAEYNAATDKYSADVSRNIAGAEAAMSLGSQRFEQGQNIFQDVLSANTTGLQGSLALGQQRFSQESDRYASQVSQAVQGWNIEQQKLQNRRNSLIQASNITTGLAGGVSANVASQAGQLSNIWGQYSESAQNALLQSGSAWAGLGSSLGTTVNNLLLANALSK